MSAMSELDAELQLYWEPAKVGVYYSRTLPNGQVATIAAGGSKAWSLTVNYVRTDHDSLPGAIVAAGQIARQHLANEARTWAA